MLSKGNGTAYYLDVKKLKDNYFVIMLVKDMSI